MKVNAINNNIIQQYNDLLIEKDTIQRKYDTLKECVHTSIVEYIKTLQTDIKEKDDKIRKLEESYKKSQETMRGQKKALADNLEYQINTLTRERDKYKVELEQLKHTNIQYSKEIEMLKQTIRDKDIKIEQLQDVIIQKEMNEETLKQILNNTEKIMEMIENISNDITVKTAARSIKETINEYKKSDELKRADLEKSVTIALDYIRNGYKTNKEMVEKYGYSHYSGLSKKIDTIKKKYLHIVEAYVVDNESKESIQKKYGKQSIEILEILDSLLSAKEDNIENDLNKLVRS